MGTGVILLLSKDQALLSWTEVASRDPLKTLHAKSLMLQNQVPLGLGVGGTGISSLP